MSEKNYDIYLDLGSSKIRVTAFDKQEKNQIFFLEKDCLTCLKLNQLNLLETDHIIEETVFEIEKKTGEYLSNINLMLDTSDAFSIILSVSKKNEKKIITKQDVQYLIQDAKQQILSGYSDKSIYILL